MTCNCDKGVDIDRTMSTYKEEFTHSFSLREIWKNGEWKYKKFCFKMNSILYNHLLCLQSGNSTAYCKWNYIGSINIYAASVSSCYLLKSCKSHMDLTYLKKKNLVYPFISINRPKMILLMDFSVTLLSPLSYLLSSSHVLIISHSCLQYQNNSSLM